MIFVHSVCTACSVCRSQSLRAVALSPSVDPRALRGGAQSEHRPGRYLRTPSHRRCCFCLHLHVLLVARSFSTLQCRQHPSVHGCLTALVLVSCCPSSPRAALEPAQIHQKLSQLICAPFVPSLYSTTPSIRPPITRHARALHTPLHLTSPRPSAASIWTPGLWPPSTCT